MPAQERPAYPHPDDVDLHEQQHPVEDHQQPREAESQLREADVVVVELDKLDGLGDEGQGPVDKQGCGGDGAQRMCVHSLWVCALMYVQVCGKGEKWVCQRRYVNKQVLQMCVHISE